MKLLAALLTAPLLCASALAADAPAAAAKPDLEKGQASFAAVCAACHQADGNSIVPLQPRLAHQHPEYLVKQLLEFKNGVRQEPIMLAMSSTLSEEDVHNIAAWISAQKATPRMVTPPEPEAGSEGSSAAPASTDPVAPPAADAQQLAHGQRIYRGGIAGRHIPACAGCHSPNGAGIPSQYPRLASQHPEYTIKQLTAFRDGTRANNAMMTDVAAKLNDKEIKALADYIASMTP